jgi:hypothetical protein
MMPPNTGQSPIQGRPVFGMGRLGREQGLDGRPDLIRDEPFGHVRVVDEVVISPRPSRIKFHALKRPLASKMANW